MGLALFVVLLASVIGAGATPAKAGAATLQPCEKKPTGPTIDLEGQVTLGATRASLAARKRSGVRQKLIRPASDLLGEPTFPVRQVNYAATAKIGLKGGISLSRGRKVVAIRSLEVISPTGKPASIRGKIGRSTVTVFQIKGGKRYFDAESGELAQIGSARLTAGAAALLNRRLKTGKKRLRPGTSWAAFNLYSLYKVTPNEDPTGETPEVPPVKIQPSGALPVQSAAVIKWYVRDSFIDYVATGAGTRAEGGATADPATGPLHLAYSFNFPFTSGWTVPATNQDPENTLVKGSGKVGFRYCDHTINFTVADPEIELEGDTNSRLIFTVNGTDGTAFPDQRAVMVKLMPGRADPPTVTDNGDGTKTVSYSMIPGFIPAEATGIFADFYFPYSPDYEGQDPRPDRFGFLSLEYTYATGA